MRFAERCGLARLVDTAYEGIATGVGTKRMIGRIHTCPIKIQGIHFTSSLSVLEGSEDHMIFGIDMLKRHQCTIDLRKNQLIIGGMGVPFLSEADLLESNRLTKKKAKSQKIMKDNGQSSKQAAPDSSSATTSQSSQFPEADILQLTKKGYSRDQAINELTNANGDVNKALMALIVKSFSQCFD